MSYTIVGVIGHIDHGKTSLVAALTGVDTDTHPEEKRRGITIDLGFASYTDGDHQFALIDAPGHQKYIGNLLAGVSAVDVGLLVVACDQGIQAQTLEHAAILQSLGVSKLVVAMSRIDLADDSTRQELAEELDLFLADFGFHDIPKIPISSVTGAGLEELKQQLREFARTTQRVTSSFFRMPIDRVFTIEGRGCVVAGTPWSGSVSIGDHVELVRTGQDGRVRELEVHGHDVEKSQVGMRTAINLAGVSASDLVRGDELVATGTHRPASRIVAELALFADASELRCPATVQLHTATTACEARISGVRRIGAGESAIVIVDTEYPIVATYAQQCLFRKPYPVGSFAGGRLLGCVEPGARQRTRLLELGSQLASGDAVARLAAWVHFHGELDIDPQWCELQVGIPASELDSTVESCLEDGTIDMPLAGRLVSRQTIDRIRGYVVKLMTHQAEATDDAWLAEEAMTGRASSAGSADVIRTVVDQLVKDKTLVRFNQMIALASDQTVLSKKQRAKMDLILEMYRDSRTPPMLKEVAQQLQSTIESVTSLVRFASQQHLLIDLGGGLFMSRPIFAQLCRELKTLLETTPQQPVAAIRDHWQITRKHAIPLLEYCDRMGVTVRQQDLRGAGPALEEFAEEQVVEQN